MRKTMRCENSGIEVCIRSVLQIPIQTRNVPQGAAGKAPGQNHGMLCRGIRHIFIEVSLLEYPLKNRMVICYMKLGTFGRLVWGRFRGYLGRFAYGS